MKLGTIEITNKKEALISPLINQLFNVGFIERVLIGNDFITLTKNIDGHWEVNFTDY